MFNDWRFKGSPPVAKGGLCSYAGAQLRCKTLTGESVALGSLCIASNTEQPILSSAQQTALVRFADMLTAEIVSYTREARRRQRHVMAQLLAECRIDELEGTQTRILAILREVYPSAHIEICEANDAGLVPLPTHAPIDPNDVQDGLWEDTEFIEELIETSNNTKLSTSRTIRAILFPCQTHPVHRYLVVSSTQLQTVFDDIDAWFVERCSASLAKIIQEHSLTEALMAKEKFLRGITHQLRTPIHGVLGSCELLAEELLQRNMLQDESQAPVATTSSIIKTIRDSGKELMSTVNNMLKLNRWAETVVSRKPAGPQAWAQLEGDILHDVDQAIPDHELLNVSLFFENYLISDGSLAMLDMTLLKECIQSLILNALHATREGAVVTVITATPDCSRVIVDVLDTGCGIAPADHSRVFEAYEKVNIHSRGAGLGLTLAANIAKLMNGSVTLVTSSQDPEQHGSHFRAEFYAPPPPTPADSTVRASSMEAELHCIPRTFQIVRDPGHTADLVMHFASYLEHQGFKQADTAGDSFALIPYTPDLDEFQRLVATTGSEQISICLAPTGALHNEFCDESRVRFFSGPFSSSRLQDIMRDIDQNYRGLQIERSSMKTVALEARKDGIYEVSQVELEWLPVEVVPFALLVDDNMVNLRILRMYCVKRGIEHITAVNGQEAIDRFEESVQKGRPFNLVLMDLQMPVRDGIEATEQIRSIEKEAGPAAVMPSRIFMVTGQDSAADKARSVAAGADEFYVKPMGMKMLDAGIGQYFPGFERTLVASKSHAKS